MVLAAVTPWRSRVVQQIPGAHAGHVRNVVQALNRKGRATFGIPSHFGVNGS